MTPVATTSLGTVLAPAMGAVAGTVLGRPDSALFVHLSVAGIQTAALRPAALVPPRRALARHPSATLRHTRARVGTLHPRAP